MSKLFLVHDDARRALGRGVDKLATIVKSTLGPKGRNVIIDRPFASPMVSNDGVFIANEVSLEDPFENMGAQLAKEVASHTNEAVGDGTTTATVLAQAMVQLGLDYVAQGLNPVLLKRGMEYAVDKIVIVLKQLARGIEGNEITRVAALAAKDEKIGRLIAEAVQRVGEDGTIVVEESKHLETIVQIVEGMQFDRGFISHNMVTDPNKMEAVLDNPYILLVDDKIESADVLYPVIEQIQNGCLLLIAEDIASPVLGMLVHYQEETQNHVVAVRSPEFGIHRKLTLEDIAILTGTKVVSESNGLRIEQVTLADLGRARQVRVDKDTTSIIDGKGQRELIRGRQQQIRHQLENTFQEFEREKLQQRLSRLSSGIAMILAGGTTSVERRERQLRIEDALNATQAAVQEGIVPGGGVALLLARNQLEDENWLETLRGAERVGAEIVLRVLTTPLKTMVENCGRSGDEVVEELKNFPEGWGYDALKDEYVEMFSEGIVDPVRVTYCALQNAASIAGLIIMTESLITEKPEEDNPTQGASRGGGAERFE